MYKINHLLLAEFPLEIANKKSAAPETLTKPQFAIFTTEKQVAVKIVPCTLLGESGTFSFDFQVKPIPEPTSTIGLGVVGLIAFSLFRHKKCTANRLGSG